MVWGRILGRFEDLGQGFSTTRPLRFCMSRRLGYGDRNKKLQPRKREKHYLAEFLVFVAPISLWLSFPGPLNMARRNARSV